MRHLLFTGLVLCCPWSLASAQKWKPFRLMTPDGYVEGASTDKEVRKAHPDREYHWLKGGELHATRGGHAGRLLHGPYMAFDRNGQLRGAGRYWYGLKDGEWKQWGPEGRLQELQRWGLGRREGRSVILDEAGRPIRSERYRHGVLKQVDEPAGDTLKADVRHGIEKEDPAQDRSTDVADPNGKKVRKAERTRAKEQARSARRAERERAAQERRMRERSIQPDFGKDH